MPLDVNSSKLKDEVRRFQSRVGDRASQAMFDETQTTVPRATGRLARSGSVSRAGRGRWRLRYRDEKASWLDNSPPHVIRARRASVLVFFWPRVGRTIFTPRVNHPGVQLRWWSSVVTQRKWISRLRGAVARIR